MLASLLGLAVKNWKWVAAAAALAILGWWHQHEVTRAYRQGATDREASALVEAAARVEADVAARRRNFDQEQTRLDVLEAKVQGERAALVSARAGVSAALAASLNQIASQGVVARNEIQSIPDDAVNGRLRLSLERARAAEAERAGGNTSGHVYIIDGAGTNFIGQ